MSVATLPSQETQPISQSNRKRKSLGKSRTAWLLTGVFLAGVIGGVIFFEEYLEDRILAKRFGIVEPGQIYRSGQISQFMIEETLVKHGIQVIVDLTHIEPDHPDQLAEQTAAKKHGITHLRYSLEGDGTGDVEVYASAVAKVHECVEAGKPVLVHCAAGAQRTGGVIALYRMLVQKKDPKFAYAELPLYSWRAHKDQALITYLNTNMEKLSELLVEKKVIQTVPSPLPWIGEKDKK